jgi:F-type H+-transporting ATPase subunit delta
LYTATELSAQASKGKNTLHADVAKDIDALAGALTHEEWSTFFKSPIITNADRLQTLNEMWAKIGASDITRQFFTRIVEGKNTQYVKEMVAAYQQILRSQKGEIEASVVTSSSLTDVETSRLKEIIVEEFLGGRKDGNVVLTQEVDEQLLGGLTLTVGSTYVDLSIKSQIEEISVEYGAVLTANRENTLQRKV